MTRHVARVTMLSLLMLVAVPLYLAAQQEGPRGGAAAGGGGAAGGASERGSSGGSSGGSGGGSGGSGGGSSAPSAISSSGGSSGGAIEAPSPRPWSARESAMDRGSRRSEGNQPAHDGPPPYSRPRGDHPATGQAVPRSEAPPTPGRQNTIILGNSGYYPGYYDYYNRAYPYGYGAFGLGYFYYDPMGWSYPSGYWYGYPTYGGSQLGYEGAIRLKIKPADAEVYLDGYFVGQVDDFDGIFQRLRVDYGPHRIEVRAPGYESLVFEIRAQVGRTITYRGELKRLP